MSNRYCIVPNCGSCSKNNALLKFHTFPNKSFFEWAGILQLKGVDKSRSDSIFICEKHFKPDDYNQYRFQTILKRGAVPSIGIPIKIQSTPNNIDAAVRTETSSLEIPLQEATVETPEVTSQISTKNLTVNEPSQSCENSTSSTTEETAATVTTTTKKDGITVKEIGNKEYPLEKRLCVNRGGKKYIMTAKSMRDMCRICFSSADLNCLFTTTYKDVKMSDIVGKLINRPLLEGRLSRSICLKCMKSLGQLHKFIERCNVSENLLRLCHRIFYGIDITNCNEASPIIVTPKNYYTQNDVQKYMSTNIKHVHSNRVIRNGEEVAETRPVKTKKRKNTKNRNMDTTDIPSSEIEYIQAKKRKYTKRSDKTNLPSAERDTIETMKRTYIKSKNILGKTTQQMSTAKPIQSNAVASLPVAENESESDNLNETADKNETNIKCEELLLNECAQPVVKKPRFDYSRGKDLSTSIAFARLPESLTTTESLDNSTTIGNIDAPVFIEEVYLSTNNPTIEKDGCSISFDLLDPKMNAITNESRGTENITDTTDNVPIITEKEFLSAVTSTIGKGKSIDIDQRSHSTVPNINNIATGSRFTENITGSTDNIPVIIEAVQYSTVSPTLDKDKSLEIDQRPNSTITESANLLTFNLTCQQDKLNDFDQGFEMTVPKIETISTSSESAENIDLTDQIYVTAPEDSIMEVAIEKSNNSSDADHDSQSSITSVKTIATNLITLDKEALTVPKIPANASNKSIELRSEECESWTCFQLGCGKVFPSAFERAKHNINKHLVSRCDICGRSHRGQRRLKMHFFKTHELRTSYKCNTCHSLFAKVASYLEHKKDCSILTRIDDRA